MRQNTKIINEFQEILKQKKLAHAYLFEGGNTKSRKDFAIFLAQSQYCTNLNDNLPCGKCIACQNIVLGDNPDVLEINTDKKSIGVDEVKYFKDAMSRGAVSGKTKILIINDAEKMTTQAANNLLKFIEEPEGNVLIIMLTTFRSQILPTILSRVQSFKLADVDEKDTIEYLTKQDFSIENAKLILKSTGIQNVVSLSNEDFSNIKKATVSWFEKAIKNDYNAFIEVQTKLKNLANSNSSQQIIFDLIGKLFSDLLALRYDLPDVVFLNRQFETTISSQNLVDEMDEYLLAVTRWKSNVSFQACMEVLTLNMIKV